MGRRQASNRRILINSSPFEKRIAILEDNHLADVFYENNGNDVRVGNIYNGVVNAVLPGLQAAFVDLGTDKAGFLHVEDVVDRTRRLNKEYGDDDGPAGSGGKAETIDSLLKVGQELLVQIIKEPISTKGPKLTTHVTLPGRFLVCMPGTNFVGVSKRSRDNNKRRELKRLVQKLKGDNVGYIVRTLGLNESPEEIAKQIEILESKWHYCLERVNTMEAPALVNQESDLMEKTLREYFAANVSEVIVDNREEYDTIVDYLKVLSPDRIDRVKFFQEKEPLFDYFGLEDELDKTFESKVFLRRGGYLVIEQNEALVSIDVNTGSKVKGKNQGRNIVETNVDAAWEIAKQMRLRDLGGLVVIDFIDMEREDDIETVENEFKKAIRQDNAPIHFSLISQFGLMELTRKRVKANVVKGATHVCPMCQGNKYIPTKEVILARIDRWLRRCRAKSKIRNLSLALHQEMLQRVTQNRSHVIKYWELKYRFKLDLLEHEMPNFTAFFFFNTDTNDNLTPLYETTYSDQETLEKEEEPVLVD